MSADDAGDAVGSDAGSDGSDADATAETANPMWGLYREYGRANAGWAAAGVAGTVAARLLSLVPAYLVGLAVDAIFLEQRVFSIPLLPAAATPTDAWAQIELVVGLLAAATVFGALFSWVQAWAWTVFAQTVQYGLRTDAYEALQDLDLAFFARRRTGDIMAVLNNDVDQLEAFLEDGLSSSLEVLAVFFGIGSVLFLLNAPLTVVTMVPVLVLGAFTAGFLRVIEPRYFGVRERVGDLNARLENNVAGIETVKTEHAEAHEAGRVREAARDYLDATLRAVKVQVAFFPGINLISGLGFATVFLLGGYWVVSGPPFGLSGSLSPGEFVTFTIYAQQFIWPVIQFGGVVDDYGRANAAARRVDEILAREPAVTDAPDAEPLDVDDGRVEYDGVDFAYRGDTSPADASARPDASRSDRRDSTGEDESARPVLRDVSFDVAGGSTVGVVGPTGAGKSTLLKLLNRLYDPDAGSVRVDGQDVRDVTLASLREQVGYVNQDPFLFFGTVAENIRYGSFDATRAEVEAAAEAAQADTFVENLPDGYDTMVGERGVKLSGGQRQRVALARAILKDPEILVLDEATSHVDTETEALIQRSLADLVEDRTAFVIAHRLSTVRQADRVLVLDDGRVVEDGTHEALLDADGLYANLWKVQVGELDALTPDFVERARRHLAETRDGDADES